MCTTIFLFGEEGVGGGGAGLPPLISNFQNRIGLINIIKITLGHILNCIKRSVGLITSIVA